MGRRGLGREQGLEIDGVSHGFGESKGFKMRLSRTRSSHLERSGARAESLARGVLLEALKS